MAPANSFNIAGRKRSVLCQVRPFRAGTIKLRKSVRRLYAFNCTSLLRDAHAIETGYYSNKTSLFTRTHIISTSLIKPTKNDVSYIIKETRFHEGIWNVKK